MNHFLIKDRAIKNFLRVFKIERKKKFVELDIEFMKSLETSNLERQTEITNQKNTLRDFPTTITEDSFSTIEELRALWPTSSLDLPNSWY
jgi:hypothetical protein